MLFIFSTPVLIRHLWQLKTVVFLHRCLICADLFIAIFVTNYVTLRGVAELQLLFNKTALEADYAIKIVTKLCNQLQHHPAQFQLVHLTTDLAAILILKLDQGKLIEEEGLVQMTSPKKVVCFSKKGNHIFNIKMS